MLSYTLIFVAPSLIGLAILVIAFRAKKDDLPEIVRALAGARRKDDDDDGPPSLPKV